MFLVTLNLPVSEGGEFLHYVGLGSANHDPAKFANRRAFDLDREHVATTFRPGPGRTAAWVCTWPGMSWSSGSPSGTSRSPTMSWPPASAQLSIGKLPLRWSA